VPVNCYDTRTGALVVERAYVAPVVSDIRVTQSREGIADGFRGQRTHRWKPTARDRAAGCGPDTEHYKITRCRL
jgi:hypothetical protein